MYQSEEPKYVIYKITNLITKRFYVGKHKTKNIHDYYFSSCPELLHDVKILGKKNFKKEILHVYKKESTMKRREKLIVTEEFCRNPKTYNQRVGG